MGITFRHDLAAVPHPSNASTRKYGQSLVMQQQQQKYAAQQAGYDRMFQLGRDNMQNQFQMGRTKQQNEFQLGRDKTQFEQQQQLAEAERQRAFLDEARKQSSGFISDAIKNGEYDPATARKLQQNLVAEAEALGNPQLDATQRAEVLEKIRAERALLAANRMEPPPKPTRDDELKQFLGGNYDKYKDQPWVPDGKGGFTIADIPQPPEAPPVPPQSAQEYYNANEDKFQKDLDATMGAMQDAYDLDPTKPKPTPQAAWQQMQQDYQFRMQALGRNAQAAAAPAGQPFQLPSDRMAPAMGTVDPMTGQSVQAGASMPGPMPSVTQPAVGASVAAPDPGQPPAPAQQSTAMPLTANSSSQNAWSEVAAADTQQRQSMPLTANSSSRNPAGEVPMPTSQATAPAMVDGSQGTVTQSAEPNFKDLEASAQDDMDKSIIRKMKTIYGQNESPEVRGAISALLGDDPIQAAQAADYLQSVGIDLEKLTAEAQYSGTGRGQVKTSPRSNSSARYGSGRGGVRTK